MQRTLTASFDSAEAADAAREALRSIGVPAAGIAVRAPVPQAGVFDHLARMIAPDKAGDETGDSYDLCAEVPAERVAQASLILGADATSGAAMAAEQVFEFPETREELRIEKQAVVTEQVVLRKRVVERAANVSATLRRTEVEVEEIPAPAPASAMTSAAPGEKLRFGLKTRPE